MEEGVLAAANKDYSRAGRADGALCCGNATTHFGGPATPSRERACTDVDNSCGRRSGALPVRGIPELAKLWLLLPVLVGAALVVFVSMLLFMPLLNRSDVRRREIYVSRPTHRVGTSDDAGGAANATTDAVEDSIGVDSDKLLPTFVVELRPAHFWPNFSGGPVAPKVPRL
ncbi:hypothetical protein MTO96_001031 [Rhipicephalus appendiculatus]